MPSGWKKFRTRACLCSLSSRNSISFTFSVQFDICYMLSSCMCLVLLEVRMEPCPGMQVHGGAGRYENRRLVLPLSGLSRSL